MRIVLEMFEINCRHTGKISGISVGMHLRKSLFDIKFVIRIVFVRGRILSRAL